MRTLLSDNTLVPPVNEHDHIQGPETAPITLVEYGDFECPYCGQAYPIVKRVQRHIGDNMRFVYRHFPLTRIHPHAELAAEAAEAAGAQGKFWEMHDILFENQNNLEPPDLLHYATRLGLDTNRFSRALATHIYAPYVREHFMSGVHSGVNGTPTFFINGERYDESWDAESLINALEHVLLPDR